MTNPCATDAQTKKSDMSDCFGSPGRDHECQVFKIVAVGNAHDAERHDRLLTGVELGNR